MKGITNEQIAWVAGRVQERLAIYAESFGTTSLFLTERVAELLHPVGSEGSGSEVRSMQLQTGQRNQVQRETMEGGSHAHGSQTSTDAKRRATSGKQKAYWAKMTAKQRAAEVARRLAVGFSNKKAAARKAAKTVVKEEVK